MDNRSIFLYRSVSLRGLRRGGEGYVIRVVEVPVQGSRAKRRQIRASYSLRADGEAIYVPKSQTPCSREKLRSIELTVRTANRHRWAG